MNGRAAVVIGMGNPLRGDDGVGREVAQELGRRTGFEATIVEEDGDGTRLMDLWAGAGTVVVIDAMTSGAAAGTIRRFDAAREPLPAEAFRLSTHAVGLIEAIELERTLGTLPARLIVYAVEAASFEIGAPLSTPVEDAVPEVVRRVLEELATGARD